MARCKRFILFIFVRDAIKKHPESSLVLIQGAWLALLNDFRTFDWASEYKYPTVVLDQMKEMLAKYENV